jgi:DNA-binding NtrC family response regulator
MNRKSVLIVDDEKNIRLTLSQALEPLDLDIQTAVNGEEGLARLREQACDVLLLDLKMPGLDGMDVLRSVRETRPATRVVIITAHGTIESAVEAMKLGAVDFIQKPFAPQEIRDLVSRVIDREQLAEEDVSDYQSRVELGKRHIQEGQIDAAIEQMQTAISLEPSRPEAYNLLGALMEIRGERLEAQKYYRVAVSVDPEYKPGWDNLQRSASFPPSGRIVITGRRDKDEGEKR